MVLNFETVLLAGWEHRAGRVQGCNGGCARRYRGVGGEAAAGQGVDGDGGRGASVDKASETRCT